MLLKSETNKKVFVDKKKESRGKENELYKEGAAKLIFLSNNMLENF